MGGRWGLPLRPPRRPAPRCTPSTRRHRRCRARCTSGTCSPTRTPTPWRASSGCTGARSSTRWGGTTTGCPPSTTCRTSTASAATRRSPTSRASSRRPSRTRTSRCPFRAATSSSCATCLAEEDEKAFESTWRRLGLSVDWSMTYATIDENSQAHVGRNTGSCATWPGTGQGVPERSAVSLGRHVPHHGRTGRARRPERPGAYHKLRFHRTDGDGDLLINTTRPELLAACVALVAHPDRPRGSSRCSAPPCARRCSTSRCRCSRTSSPIPRRAPASR